MNTNPNIELDSTFISAVRAYSFISKSTTSITDDDIRTIALNDVYPRIITRIALTTDKAGVPIFGGIGDSTGYSAQYIKSMEVLSLPPYSFGIRRIAIALTASTIIRIIPLKADINLVDAAESIEKGAIQDLDKLTGVLAQDTTTLSAIRSQEGTKQTSYKAFFISQDIDESTIPERAFNLIEGNIAIYKGAKTHSQVKLREGEVGICVVTLSCQTRQAVVKDAFIIESGSTTTDITTLIAQTINGLNIELGTGIIASPNKGAAQLIKIPIAPIRLYPHTSLDNNLQLLIELTPTIDVIEVVSQLLSPIRDKEVIMIDLFTLPPGLLPTTVPTVHDLINATRFGTRGIKGVVYGTLPKYTELTHKGPHASVIEVEKGGLVSKTEEQLLTPSTTSSKSEQFPIDTFHFKLGKNFLTLSPSNIKVRVSTQPSIDEVNTWVYPFPGGSLDDLVTGLLDSMFINSRPTSVVGAITAPHALQMVPHLTTDDETRIVVDLINLPSGVEVSTGTDRLPITQFKLGTRSINIPCVRLSASEQARRADSIIRTSAINAKVSPTTAHQGVSDKLVNLREKLGSMQQCGSPSLRPSCNLGCNPYANTPTHRYYTLNDIIDIYKNGNL